MDGIDMTLHIRKFTIVCLPVPRVRITSVIILGLPAIVDDYGIHPSDFGESALVFDPVVRYVLMHAVPGRIHRYLGIIRNKRREILRHGAPPLLHAFQTVIVRNVSCIK
ncbi:hypothetical protein D3C73_1474540 [compost metagenome]